MLTQDLQRMPETISMPDGFNGSTVTLNTKVVREDAHCVQLHTHDAPYLTRWVLKSEYSRTLVRSSSNESCSL